MKDVLIALIITTPSTITAFLAYKESKRTHKLINSRMDELLQSARKLSRAEGIEEGRRIKK